ncbi:translation elongation factor [Anopheles darlingi]|uniref:Translation elongation factor n=1 Tax=Anopheles darlingi TaxID=43151 RepID=W5J2J5_ANODA|nr:translation elongation factor [Anopheles darlingi]
MADVTEESPSKLLAAYNKLKQRFAELTNENQNLCQENYDLKRNLQSLTQTNDFLSGEVESVASELRDKLASEHSLVNKLTEELQLAKASSKETTEQLEQDVDRMRNEINQLKQDITDAEERALVAHVGTSNASHSDSLQIKSFEMEEEIASLKIQLERTEMCLQQANLEIARLSNENAEHSERYSSLRGNYDSKKEELEEMKNLLEMAQEQASVLASEIASMRSNPENDLSKKGNSLFAEVDDQRKKMIGIIKNIKDRYNDLKMEHRNCPAKIRQLRNMNDSLARDLKPYMSRFYQAESKFREALLEQITDLSTQLQKAKERNKFLEKQLCGNSAEWVNSLTDYYKAQTDSLEARLKVFQFKHRLAEEDHWLAKKDLCKWRTEALRLKQLECIQQLEKLDHENDENDFPALKNDLEANAADRSANAEPVVVSTASIKTESTDSLSRVMKTELLSDESGPEDGQLDVKFAKEKMSRVDLSTLQRLQADAGHVRNICILAHVDHGKTTLADSLIASNGIISARLAGKLRYMDSRPDEQERQITMKSSSITLHYRQLGPPEQDYLINLIDSPGHVDFSSEVSTAIRLCDGAIIVVDVVEGVCPQTRVCLQQAYREQLSTVLLLNKIDRLVLEKRMDPLEAYQHLVKVLEQVNAVVGNLFATDVLAKEEISATGNQTSALEDADDSVLYYSPQQGNVLFGSALDGWAFDLATFARLYQGKLEGVTDSYALLEGLWGDYFYSPRRKAIENGASEKGRKPLFVQLVLDNLWNIYGLVEARDEAKLRSISERCGVVQNPRDLRHADGRVPVRNLLSGWLPIEQSLLGAICSVVPNPTGISEAKAERLLCSRLSDFASYPQETKELKNDIMRCDPASDRLIVFVSKMFPIEQGAMAGARETLERLVKNLSLTGDGDAVAGESEIFLAFARVYSGTLRRGTRVFVLGPKYDPRTMADDTATVANPHLVEVEIDSLFVLMGRQLEPVESVPAGNIVGIGGLQNVVLKTATLSSTRFCPPFVDLPLIATPILRVAVEPRDIQNMPRLVRGLKLLNQADACVEVRVQESGEHVLLTLGEVHLERCIKDLQETYARIELNVSKPIVPFKETIVPFVPTSEENPEEEIAKDREKDKTVTLQTPNRQCTMKLVAIPLPAEVVQLLIENEHVLKAYFQHQDTKQSDCPQALLDSIGELRTKLKQLLPETVPFDRIWSFGPKKCGTNLLVNRTDFVHSSVWHDVANPLNEEDQKDPRVPYESGFLNGFQMASLAGPLCDEPMQGVCFIVERWELDMSVGVDVATVASHGPLSGE